MYSAHIAHMTEPALMVFVSGFKKNTVTIIQINLCIIDITLNNIGHEAFIFLFNYLIHLRMKKIY